MLVSIHTAAVNGLDAMEVMLEVSTMRGDGFFIINPLSVVFFFQKGYKLLFLLYADKL